MIKPSFKVISLAVLLPLTGCQITADNHQSVVTEQAKSPLTLEAIYKKHEFRSQWMGKIRWLDDGSGYTAIEKSQEKISNKKGKKVPLGRDIVVYDPQTLKHKILVSARELIPSGEEKPLAIHDYIWSKDRSKLLIYTNSKRVWRSNSRGDYYLLDMQSKKLTKLGGNLVKPSTMMFAKFSPDASKIAFVFNNNIYVQDLTTQKIKQLTKDSKNGKINGLFDWVYEEEFGIRDGFRWSPDGSKIAYWQLDTSGSKDFILINNTDSLYPKITKFPYPKVGETNALANIGIVDIRNAKTVWVKLPKNSRNMYVPRMNWSGNSDEILVQHLNRKQDTDHFYLANAKTGNVKEIYTEHDAAFLDNITDAKWLNNGKQFIWASEKSGWRHYYLINRNGAIAQDLTPGDFDVVEVAAIDDKNGWLYYIASPNNVAQRYLFRSSFDGKTVNQQLTPEKFAGFNGYQMSPNGEWAIHRFSNFDTPNTVSLVHVADHKVQKTLVSNKKLKQKLAKLYNKATTEFFQVTARDGVVLDGYIMRPADFDPNKKYPIIFYVYGEPWGQTVQNRWRGSSYLWDTMMTQQGYLIASIDNRGTRAPKGRAWRKSIYGGVGVLSSRDQSDALKQMAQRWSYIDTNRVGIWGHSGGGSMTLNMMFRYPEQYKVGIALAPVADQRLYDTIYQERYSGLLPEYADSYKKGSPITYAKNLKGNLLLIHGTGDDNVHYQGTEKLINELVKYNKQFDFMSYPNRSHGIWEGEGTTLHLKTLMKRYFNEHL